MEVCIFNFLADIYGAHDNIIFAAAANSTLTEKIGTELTILNHSTIGTVKYRFIDKMRLVIGTDNYAYIDVHINSTVSINSNYPEATFTFTADNLNWSFLDSFETKNTDYGTEIMEVSLQN